MTFKYTLPKSYLCCKNNKSQRNTSFTARTPQISYQFWNPLKNTPTKNTLIYTLWRSTGLVTFANIVTKLLLPHNITSLSFMVTKRTNIFKVWHKKDLVNIFFGFECDLSFLNLIFDEKNVMKIWVYSYQHLCQHNRGFRSLHYSFKVALLKKKHCKATITKRWKDIYKLKSLRIEANGSIFVYHSFLQYISLWYQI